MNALRNPLLLLLMLILPLQGLAGVTMNMCASGTASSHESAQLIHHGGQTCHHMAMSMGESSSHADMAPAETTSQPSSGDCPHCFALSHFIAIPALSIPKETLTSAPIPFHAASFISLTLDQPVRPPVST